MSGPITATNRTSPNRILISTGSHAGEGARIGDLPAGAAITPGMGIEMYALSAGVNAWRPQSGALNTAPMIFALDRPEFNTAFSTAYAIGDQVKAYAAQFGDILYVILLSGQTVANGGYVQPDGTGKFKASTAVTATSNLGRLQCLDNPGAVGADTYIRVQVVA